MANSYSKDYDPDDWLQVDRATGQIQTQRVLSPASPFLKDGWYRAIVLAYDDGECQAVPGLPGSLPRLATFASAQGLRAVQAMGPAPRSGGGGWGGGRLPQQGTEPTRPLLPTASPPSTATGTLSIEILEVNDHAPELSPPSGSVCSKPDQGSGLLLGATDADLPPHGAPFHFQLSPGVPELTRNWSITQVNGGFSAHSPEGADLSPKCAQHRVLAPQLPHVGQGPSPPVGGWGH